MSEEDDVVTELSQFQKPEKFRGKSDSVSSAWGGADEDLDIPAPALKEKYLALKQDYEDFEESSKDYEAELETEISHLTMEVQKASLQASRAQSLLAESRAFADKERHMLTSKLESQQKQFEDLQKDRDRLRTSKVELEQEHTRLERDYRVLEAKYQAQQEEAERLAEEKELQAADLEANNEQQVSRLKEQLRESKSEVTVLKSSLSSLEGRNRELQTELESSQKDINTLKEMLTQERKELMATITAYAKKSDEEKKAKEQIEKDVHTAMEEMREAHDQMVENRRHRTDARMNYFAKKNEMRQKRRAGDTITEEDRDQIKQLQEAFQRYEKSLNRELASRRERRERAKMSSSVLDRLTDTTLYTATARQRFNSADEERSDGPVISDLSQITRPNLRDSAKLNAALSRASRAQRGSYHFKTIYVFQNGAHHREAVPFILTRGINTFDKLLLHIGERLKFPTGACRKLYSVTTSSQESLAMVHRTRDEERGHGGGMGHSLSGHSLSGHSLSHSPNPQGGHSLSHSPSASPLLRPSSQSLSRQATSPAPSPRSGSLRALDIEPPSDGSAVFFRMANLRDLTDGGFYIACSGEQFNVGNRRLLRELQEHIDTLLNAEDD